MTTAPTLISLESLAKRFDSVRAVDGVSLEIRSGEFLSLLGGSGCGKTTLLRLIAGLDQPDSGRIIIDGIDVTAQPAYERPVNTVFQSYALFPHMTVDGNIAFGLRQERLPRAEIRDRVAWALALVRLEGFERRRPDELSGGQRQRVAIARAIAKRPKILLLDEPMAALDRRLREATRFELAALRERLGITFVLVTHDQEEAMALSDRIAVMDAGRVAQVGAPREIYDRPASRFVAEFVGDANLIDGVVESQGATGVIIRADGLDGPITVAGGGEFPAGSPVTVILRPEHVQLGVGRPSAGPRLTATVDALAYQGNACLAQLLLPGGRALRALRSSAEDATNPLARGDAVEIGWSAADLRLVPR
ncbi:MAG: ABC transporter ATP-binding protein [Alphaproteobacteria bacterium]